MRIGQKVKVIDKLTRYYGDYGRIGDITENGVLVRGLGMCGLRNFVYKPKQIKICLNE